MSGKEATPLTNLARAYVENEGEYIGDKILEGRRIIEAYTEQAIRDMVRHAAGHTTDGSLFRLFDEPRVAELHRGDLVDVTRHGKTEHYVVREPRGHGAILDRLR